MLPTLRTRVHDNLGNHSSEEEPVEAEGEPEACPIMPVFKHLQGVAIEINVAIEVLFVKSLEGNLAPSLVLGAIGILLESEVVFNRAARIGGLLILPWSHARGYSPEDHKNRNSGESTKEKPCFETTANLPREVQWDQCQQCKEQLVRETLAARSICWKRSILD